MHSYGHAIFRGPSQNNYFITSNYCIKIQVDRAQKKKQNAVASRQVFFLKVKGLLLTSCPFKTQHLWEDTQKILQNVTQWLKTNLKMATSQEF